MSIYLWLGYSTCHFQKISGNVIFSLCKTTTATISQKLSPHPRAEDDFEAVVVVDSRNCIDFAGWMGKVLGA